MDKNEEIWTKHWYELNKRGSLAGVLFRFYRQNIRARSLAGFFERFFKGEGVFVECGSGSAQTSARIDKGGRTLFALDISKLALDEARRVKVLDGFVRADIRKLPFKDCSLDGVWNLGVIEHYRVEDRNAILGEFHRTIKVGGGLLMFWPSWHATDKYIFRFLEFFMGFFIRDFRFFPDEPSRLRSRRHGVEIMEGLGFSGCEVFFPVGDLFTEYVVQCHKPDEDGK